METDLGLLGGGGSGGESGSAASVDEAIVEQDYMGMSSSSEGSSDPADAHLELGLGLGLSLGCGIKPATRGEYRRFFTAKDLPSAVPSHPSSSPAYSRFPSAAAAVSGTKRSADNSTGHEVPSPAVSQVVGWPPIRAYRMNNLVNQAKALSPEEEKTGGESCKFKDASKKKHNNGTVHKNSAAKEKGHLGFVKVSMDGVAIGRKVDLNAHDCYRSLAQALEEMFFRLNLTSCSSIREEKEPLRKPSRLLDGSSEFVLTYEDKEGDWMLVGDIPWEMFLNTVRRLRIMKTSEANGLGPRFGGGGASEQYRSKPI